MNKDFYKDLPGWLCVVLDELIKNMAMNHGLIKHGKNIDNT